MSEKERRKLCWVGKKKKSSDDVSRASANVEWNIKLKTVFARLWDDKNLHSMSTPSENWRRGQE